MGPKGKVYVGMHTTKSTGVVKEVAQQIAKTNPSFRFTSLQVILNSRAHIHIDSNNVGPSMATSLGPFSGGQLVVHGGMSGVHIPG